MHTLITGASSGIGEALARELHAAGHQVTLVARRKDKLEQLARELGQGARAIAADLTDPACVATLLAEAEAQGGPIDILVNNAGMENTGPTLDSDPDEGERLLRCNLITPLRLTRAVLPAMVARKSGAIVQVASLAAVVAAPGHAWYSASKAGLAQFSETLRPELRGTGVHMLVVYPGPVTTPMGDAAYAKFGGRGGAAALAPEGKPEVLAKIIRRALEKKTPRVIYPASLWVAWWFPRLARVLTHAFSPRPLTAEQLAASLKPSP